LNGIIDLSELPKPIAAVCLIGISANRAATGTLGDCHSDQIVGIEVVPFDFGEESVLFQIEGEESVDLFGIGQDIFDRSGSILFWWCLSEEDGQKQCQNEWKQQQFFHRKDLSEDGKRQNREYAQDILGHFGEKSRKL